MGQRTTDGGRPPTLRAHAEAVLRQELLSGRLAPGQRINEVAAARAIGVSRGIVREALRALAQDGLVESRPHRGIFVRKLTNTEAREMSEVRMGLELMAARRIARNGRAEEVREVLEARYADLERVVGEPFPVRLRADLAFHEAICEASGNRQLLQTWRGLVATVTSMLLTIGATDAAVVLDPARHRPLLDAIESGAERRMEEAWEEHFGNGLTYIVSRLPERAEEAA